MSTLVTVTAPDSLEAEAYRTLRTNLDVATHGDVGVLLLASPGPDQGASAAVANLAVVMAQSGRSVLVVDADFRHSRQHELLGVANDAGLGNLVGAGGANERDDEETDASDSAVARLVHSTAIDNLKVLPAGSAPSRPGDVLSSPAARALFQQLRRMAEVVLVDVPPVLALSDAGTVARYVDAVVLVLAAGKTRRDETVRAREVLDRAKATTLGVILTGVSPEDAGFEHFGE